MGQSEVRWWPHEITKTGEIVSGGFQVTSLHKKTKEKDCKTPLSGNVSSLLSSVLVCFAGSSPNDTSTIVAKALSPKGAEKWLHCSAHIQGCCVVSVSSSHYSLC